MIDVSHIPFSRFGSYIAFSHLPTEGARPSGLYLRSVRGPALQPWQPVFRLDLLLDGRPSAHRITAEPTVLRIANDTNNAASEVGADEPGMESIPLVEICLPEPAVTRIRCAGAGLRFSREASGYDFILPRGAERWVVTICGDFETRFTLHLLQGSLRIDAPWDGLRSQGMTVDLLPDAQSGLAELELVEYRAVEPRLPDPPPAFEECLNKVEMEFSSWLAALPNAPAQYAAARELAGYITWSCVVAPDGLLTRPVMFMSKNNMASIWSWDNCFNALALARGNPGLAWDQLMVMVDHQDAAGAFPDLLNDAIASRSFVKPPVYGLALRQMMAIPGFLTPARLQQIYTPLCRNTQWWFDYRDDDGDGIPNYNHGNESGWDNGTVFAAGLPVESPDLAAYLVIQMETIAAMATQLGLRGDADRWSERATDLYRRMMAHFWRGDHFVALRSGSHVEVESRSLQLFLPLILGRRLPAAARQGLAQALQAEGGFLTRYGLASESASSPLYRPVGYWRGPVWGAPAALIAAGLRDGGETALAREIATRFCDLCAQSGLSENYDALTGEPLSDRAFTWTSSAFLLLANRLLNENSELMTPVAEPSPDSQG